MLERKIDALPEALRTVFVRAIERDVFSFDGERCDRIVAGVLGRRG